MRRDSSGGGENEQRAGTLPALDRGRPPTVNGRDGSGLDAPRGAPPLPPRGGLRLDSLPPGAGGGGGGDPRARRASCGRAGRSLLLGARGGRGRREVSRGAARGRRGGL